MSKKKRTSTYRDNLRSRGEDARIVRRIVFFIFLVFLITIGIVGYKTYDYITSAFEPMDPKSEENIEIEIPMGSSSSTIANILEENELIKDARIFRFYVKFKNVSDFQAGEYTLSQSLTLDEIIESLQTGKIIVEPTYTVTIPEGKTIEEIAEIYADELPVTKDEFLEVLDDDEYIESLIDDYSALLSEQILDDDIRTPLEGYLFAATYSFYEENPTVETIVEYMLNKTVEVIQPLYEDIGERDLSIHEIITMASLIEKEAKTEDERQMISGIFYNRMKEGMMLQTDPTVLYALGEHKERVLYEDLEVDSPYNTYKHKDLPVGPIANFGVNSLEAALYPEESDYLYFLHDYDGEIYYAKTLDEHNELKAEHRSDDDF
ncbi:MAG TPA: endolytic transglycosylase MltG [Bacillota bacterium]|nr:endolytic transglycosylase MltG [Bacillota bacterium]